MNVDEQTATEVAKEAGTTTSTIAAEASSGSPTTKRAASASASSAAKKPRKERKRKAGLFSSGASSPPRGTVNKRGKYKRKTWKKPQVRVREEFFCLPGLLCLAAFLL